MNLDATSVLEENVEVWYPVLEDLTMKSTNIDMTLEEAKAFQELTTSCSEEKKKQQTEQCTSTLRSTESASTMPAQLQSLYGKISEAIAFYGGAAFGKLSLRSPKDNVQDFVARNMDNREVEGYLVDPAWPADKQV